MSNIPQTALDHYHRCYRNDTYHAFGERLSQVIAADPAYGAAFEHLLNNLLIDSSLQRSGALFYRGAERSLMQLIRPLDTKLVSLGLAHLAHFGPKLEQPEAAVDQVWTKLSEAQAIAEDATYLASDLHGWRGRVTYAWANAAAYLLQAASAILLECRYDDYLLEKLDRSLAQQQNGVVEAHANGVALCADFMAWIGQLLKARD